jgi:hypothetical protein
MKKPGTIRAFFRGNACILCAALHAIVTPAGNPLPPPVDKEDTVQFPDAPTLVDRARSLTRNYRYRIGPTLLLGTLLTGQSARPWQAVGIFMFGALAIEGILKVLVGEPRREPGQ